MRDNHRLFITQQVQTYAKRVKAKEINESCVENLIFGDAESCNCNSLDKAAIFYYGVGYFQGQMNSPM